MILIFNNLMESVDYGGIILTLEEKLEKPREKSSKHQGQAKEYNSFALAIGIWVPLGNLQ